MNFWNDTNIDNYVSYLSSRDIDKTHQDIIKKHNQRLDFVEKKKLENLVALRPPTKNQKNAVLSLAIGGEVAAKSVANRINLTYLQDCQDYSNSINTGYKLKKKLQDVHLLETLALLRTEPKQKKKRVIDKQTEANFRKRAAAKYHTLQYLPQLIALNSPLKNSYCNSLTCSESVISKDGNLHSAFCKNRWCQVCNRIKTANLINGYYPELDKINNKQFVTLTGQNVKAENLREMLKHYNKFWRKYYLKKMDQTKTIRRELILANSIKDEEAKEQISLIYKYLKIKGIKKIECTYNANIKSEWFDTYHPHLHILINGVDNATELLNEWLLYCEQNNIIVDKAAQCIKKVDSSICKELFKYFSKITSSTGKKTKDGKKESKVFIHSLDIMFNAMKGFQVFTAFGIDKKVDEDFVKQFYTSEVIDESWIWKKTDWISKDKNKFCGYSPSKFEKMRKKYIVFDKKATFINRMPKKHIEKIDGKTYYLIEKME